jgi:hypothetical protein
VAVCSLVVTLLTACGPDSATERRAETSTSSQKSEEDGPPADAEELLGAIEATALRRTAAFEMSVEQTLPAGDAPASAVTRRTGRFDDETGDGDGTFGVTVEDPQIAAQLGYDFDPFQYRLIDDTYWNLNTVVDPHVWFGASREAFEQEAQGDLTLGVDGDLFLVLIGESMVKVIDREDTPVGGETWVVSASADDLAPLVLAGGALNRVMEAVPEDTGIVVHVTLEVDAEGMVTGFEMEMDEWWTTVVSEAVEADLGELSLSARFRLGSFDEPVVVQPPCEDPTPVAEPGEVPGMTCESAS